MALFFILSKLLIILYLNKKNKTMEKENMSLDQLDSLKTDLEDKLVKLKEELLEVENEIQGRVVKSKITEFKEMFESHVNQFCKFTRHNIDEDDLSYEIVIILCKIKEVSYDPEEDSCEVQIELIASTIHDAYYNEINFWPTEPDTISEEQFLSGRVDDIIFYESLDEVKMILKNIIDEQVK